jgi:hypothetical protein
VQKDYVGFTPYQSKIITPKLAYHYVKIPKNKKMREEAKKFQEEMNPTILEKDFYFTDKILHNKHSELFKALKGEFDSKIFEGLSTFDNNASQMQSL